MTPPITYDAAKAKLESINQAHLLRFYPELDADKQRALLAQVADLETPAIPSLIQTYVVGKPPAEVPHDISPAPYFPRDPKSPVRQWDMAACRAKGEALLKGGKVACFTVAGGQGSRLGYDGPKGCYPAGAVTNKPLFQVFAEGVGAASRKYGVTIPWYVMTSPLNHEATTSFFRDNKFFGLIPESVKFFPQGTLPSFDMKTGRILLADKGEIATNPDGHGGAVRALHLSGAIDDMRKRGVEHLSYFQVDNPLVRVVDPVFLGIHAGAAGGSSGEMTSKMVPKAGPDEKVGVFCLVDGRVQVIEYSDLPKALSQERDGRGGLRYLAGSIAVHIISVEFLTRLATDKAFDLPYHRAEKKIPHVDIETGRAIKPESNNGVKLERFIFDALALCKQSAVYETDRVEEFAPIKNAEGGDSPETCRAIQSVRNAKWLESVGVKVPRLASGLPDAVIEISPLTALEPDDLRGKSLPKVIDAGAKVAL